MFYVVSLQLNAASEMSKALKDFLKGKQREYANNSNSFIKTNSHSRSNSNRNSISNSNSNSNK